MFRFETFVKVVLVSGFCLSAPLFAAEETPVGRLSDKQFDYHVKQKEKYKCDDPKERQKNIGPCERAERALGEMGTTSKASSESCQASNDEFKTSKDTFSQACGTLGYTSGGVEGAIACSWQKERCQCLSKNFEDPDDRLQCSDVRAAPMQSSGRTRKNKIGLIDLKDAEKKMKYCPEQNPEDTERYEKQLEKSQERIKEAKKEIKELRKDGEENQQKAAEKANTAKAKAAAQEREFNKAMTDIKRRYESEKNAAIQEIANLRTEMDQIEDQMRASELKKTQAELDLREARMDIDMNCHVEGSKIAAAKQAETLAKIKQGIPGGDFSAMMRKVGVTTREDWNNVARFYKKICLQSTETRDMKKKAQNRYNARLTEIENEIIAARKARSAKANQINQVMGDCRMAHAQEPKSCQSLRQANEDMRMAYQNAQLEQNQAYDEAETSLRQNWQKDAHVAQDSGEKQTEVNDEIQRMENLRAYLDLKRQYSSGAGNKKAAEELHSSYSKMMTAARGYDQCCADGVFADGKCGEVKAFIKSTNGESAQDLPKLDELGENVDEAPASSETSTETRDFKLKIDRNPYEQNQSTK